MTSQTMRTAGLAIAAALFVLGCDETTPDTHISQFDRPQDVALVCYHDELGPLPLGCCENQGSGVEGYCDVPNPEAVLLAFVTQTTFGEVAVVDLDDGDIIDQDDRIPLNSFIPVGGQPSDIAASWDGTRVYTANFETEDVSVIDVGKVFGPTMTPATAVGIDGPGGRIAVAKAPSIRDRYLFVTQPSLGRLAVVALGDSDTAGADGGVEDADAGSGGGAGGQSRLLGYLRLDAATALPHAPEDVTPEGIVPWAIAASDVTPSLYVGGKRGNYIAEIDSEVLVAEALALDVPGPLGEAAIVRRMELGDFTTRALAVEPDLERWIYAVENELGGVVVLDLVTGELLPVNAEDPIAQDAYSINVPGHARAIAMMRLAEDDDPLPVTFDGTFGIVSTTEAAIYVIDAEDRNPVWGEPGPRHSLRASSYWCSENVVDSGTADDCVIPGIDDAPVLVGDDNELSSGVAESIATIEDVGDAGLPQCGSDGGVDFRPDDDYGIRMRCDYRITSNEAWTLSWEGEIGVSGTGVAQYGAAETTADALVVRDQSKRFCTSGVLGGDDGAAIGFADLYDGFPGLGNGSPGFDDGYPGDILEITSAATPRDGATCEEFEDVRLRYRIREMLADDTLVIVPIPGSYAVPLPSQECFGQAFNYTIRAYQHWILSGSRTGHLRYGVLDATTGQCLPNDHTAESEEKASANAQRAFEDVPFENRYLAFELLAGSDPSAVEEYDDLYYSFVTSDGFSPIGAVLGNDLTDIEPTPDDLLVLIDQAGEGLMLFDLTGTFGMDGSAIN
jgi:hypothetical protein